MIKMRRNVFILQFFEKTTTDSKLSGGGSRIREVCAYVYSKIFQRKRDTNTRENN